MVRLFGMGSPGWCDGGIVVIGSPGWCVMAVIEVEGEWIWSEIRVSQITYDQQHSCTVTGHSHSICLASPHSRIQGSGCAPRRPSPCW